MSKKSTPKAAAIAMTRELFSIVGDAGKVVGGREALGALRTGLTSVLPDDPMCRVIVSQLGTPGGDVAAALLLKGFQSWADPEGASATAADAALDAAFINLSEAIDLKAVMQKMSSALSGTEKNNTTVSEKTTQVKVKPEPDPKSTETKIVVIACEACGEKKAKRSKLKVFTIPENQRGLVPEADKQEGKQLCATCIRDLNGLLREAADAKSIEAAKATADQELVDGISKAEEKAERIQRDILHYRTKIQRLSERLNTKKQSINTLMQPGISDKDLPDTDGKPYPGMADPLWKKLFGEDFYHSGYSLVVEYQTIMTDLLYATQMLARLESGPEQEEARQEEATTPKEVNNTTSKTKTNLSRRQKKNGKKKGKK